MTDPVRLENVNVEIEWNDWNDKLEITIEERGYTNVLSVQVRKGQDVIPRMIEDMRD